ncbi:MAG: T9SS type A sorting domain-containing protein [Bacteriodetes bacterium]|nr:T9SS type A sorting domain-containing protein [Bacteroidota bacterium]
MKKLLFVLGCICCLPLLAPAQTVKEVSVLLSVKAEEKPTPHITISWVPEKRADSYVVSRKTRDANQFTIQETLSGTDSVWVDNSVLPGIGYEYEVIVNIKTSATTIAKGFGYAYGAIGLASNPIRGNALLLVDTLMSVALSNEIDQLRTDLENEGWIVSQRNVQRTETFNKDAVANAKKIVRGWYDKLNDYTRPTLFIIGRVAVPKAGMGYNGQILGAPDGHPDHFGAWAADSYYGYMGNDADWTDVMTFDKIIADWNNSGKLDAGDTAIVSARSKNFPGDGKFDNAIIPNYLNVSIGRADLYDMGKLYKLTKVVGGKTVIDSLASEIDLLKSYLKRDHDYRVGKTQIKRRGLIDANFGYFGTSVYEGFSRSGWNNFSVLVGKDNIDVNDWFTTLDTAQYLWAYGDGGGSYESASGVGSTSQFATTKVNAIFTMLFGSYFGDWDSPNNFLRGPLASQPSVLTCSWSGRPQWYYHTMALGETTGDAMLMSINTDPYFRSNGIYGVHTALMGDPTLRMPYTPINPPQNVSVTQVRATPHYVHVKWEAPAGNQQIAGYYVYRKVGNKEIEPMNEGVMIQGLEYKDEQLVEANVTYSVRAVGLTTSTTGSFYETSFPASATAKITAVDEESTSNLFAVECFPNPTRDAATVKLTLDSPQQVDVSVYNVDGLRLAQLENRMLSNGEHILLWNCKNETKEKVAHGVYFVRVTIGNTTAVRKVVVID